MIVRRYARSLDNFFNRYMPMADAWLMLDNSHHGEPSRIAQRDIDGPLQIFDEDVWRLLSSRHMKPSHEANEPLAARVAFKMADLYVSACSAVRETLARHKALAQSIVVWDRDRSIELQPEQIEHP